MGWQSPRGGRASAVSTGGQPSDVETAASTQAVTLRGVGAGGGLADKGPGARDAGSAGLGAHPPTVLSPARGPPDQLPHLRASASSSCDWGVGVHPDSREVSIWSC